MISVWLSLRARTRNGVCRNTGLFLEIFKAVGDGDCLTWLAVLLNACWTRPRGGSVEGLLLNAFPIYLVRSWNKARPFRSVALLGDVRWCSSLLLPRRGPCPLGRLAG